LVIIQAVWGVKRRNTAAYEEADGQYCFIEGISGGRGMKTYFGIPKLRFEEE